MHNPDLMKFADSFGVAGLRARDPLEVGTLAKKAVDMDRSVLIERSR